MWLSTCPISASTWLVPTPCALFCLVGLWHLLNTGSPLSSSAAPAAAGNRPGGWYKPGRAADCCGCLPFAPRPVLLCPCCAPAVCAAALCCCWRAAAPVRAAADVVTSCSRCFHMLRSSATFSISAREPQLRDRLSCDRPPPPILLPLLTSPPVLPCCCPAAAFPCLLKPCPPCWNPGMLLGVPSCLVPLLLPCGAAAAVAVLVPALGTCCCLCCRREAGCFRVGVALPCRAWRVAWNPPWKGPALVCEPVPIRLTSDLAYERLEAWLLGLSWPCWARCWYCCTAASCLLLGAVLPALVYPLLLLLPPGMRLPAVGVLPSFPRANPTPPVGVPRPAELGGL
jgi:hypothetical protein